MIFIFGPSCSGKTTILRKFEKKSEFSTYIFDEEIDKLIEDKKIKKGEILTDEFIDEAIEIYFRKLKNMPKLNLLCEIPYHNYEELFLKYPFINNYTVIALFAPLEILLERNSQRLQKKHIPRPYIERCLASINKIKVWSKITSFDTSKHNIEDIIKDIEVINE